MTHRDITGLSFPGAPKPDETMATVFDRLSELTKQLGDAQPTVTAPSTQTTVSSAEDAIRVTVHDGKTVNVVLSEEVAAQPTG